MIELRLAVAFLLPIALGWIVLCVIVPMSKLDIMPSLERLGAGYGIGAGTLTIAMLALGVLGLPLTFPVVLLTLLSLLVALTLIAVRLQRPVWPALHPKNRLSETAGAPRRFRPSLRVALEGLLILGLFYQLAVSWIEVFLRPVFAWDAFTYWSLYARVFFVEKRLLLSTSQITASGPASSHPIHVPLLQDWFALALDQWNDVLVNTPFVAYYTALILLIYSGLRRLRSRTIALLIAFLVSSLPLLAAHAGVPQGDLPVTYYASAAALYLSTWLGRRHIGLLVCSLVFAALGVWTKTAGILVLAIIVTLVILSVVRDLHGPAARARYLLLLVPVIVIALLSLRLASLPLPFSTGWRLVFQTDVLQPYLRDLLLGGSWSLTWGVFLIVTVLCWRHIWSSTAQYPFLFTWAGLLSFLALYLFLPQYHTDALNGTLMSRNTLIFAPMGIYSVGLAIAARVRAPTSRGRSRGLRTTVSSQRLPIASPHEGAAD